MDFQFSNGNSAFEGNNHVTLSNFTFGGGAAVGSPTIDSGVASGTLGSSVSLTDANSASDFFQQFTPGTEIGFDVTSTTNQDPGLTHDLFTASILDNTTGEITTNSPNTLDLLEADINTALNGGNVQKYFQSGDRGATPGSTAVPEPGTALFGVALVGAASLARRRKQRA